MRDRFVTLLKSVAKLWLPLVTLVVLVLAAIILAATESMEQAAQWGDLHFGIRRCIGVPMVDCKLPNAVKRDRIAARRIEACSGLRLSCKRKNFVTRQSFLAFLKSPRF
jgi:hypothetical protein